MAKMMTRQCRSNFITKTFFVVLSCVFMLSFIMSSSLFAQEAALDLPAPGDMVMLSEPFVPPLVQGVTVHPDNPFRFDFLITTGDVDLEGISFERESTKLIKYFLAAITVPEEDLWVNLSPTEEGRVIPDQFGITEMGRDMLAQDYLLKQLSASLMYPEEAMGKKFWDRIKQRSVEEYGTIDIPMNTFNKVWILPESATVYQNGNSAYVADSHLKIMLDEDVAALESQTDSRRLGLDGMDAQTAKDLNAISSAVVREIVIPAIEEEVNNGKHFAQLRQIYNSMILAVWFKKTLKDSLLGQVYADRNKVTGIDLHDKAAKDAIFEQYMDAYKQGVYDMIQDDYDPALNESIPRKYFSGGFFTRVTPQNVGRQEWQQQWKPLDTNNNNRVDLSERTQIRRGNNTEPAREAQTRFVRRVSRSLGGGERGLAAREQALVALQNASTPVARGRALESLARSVPPNKTKVFSVSTDIRPQTRTTPPTPVATNAAPVAPRIQQSLSLARVGGVASSAELAQMIGGAESTVDAARQELFQQETTGARQIIEQASVTPRVSVSLSAPVSGAEAPSFSSTDIASTQRLVDSVVAAVPSGTAAAASRQLLIEEIRTPETPAAAAVATPGVASIFSEGRGQFRTTTVPSRRAETVTTKLSNILAGLSTETVTQDERELFRSVATENAAALAADIQTRLNAGTYQAPQISVSHDIATVAMLSEFERNFPETFNRAYSGTQFVWAVDSSLTGAQQASGTSAGEAWDFVRPFVNQHDAVLVPTQMASAATAARGLNVPVLSAPEAAPGNDLQRFTAALQQVRQIQQQEPQVRLAARAIVRQYAPAEPVSLQKAQTDLPQFERPVLLAAFNRLETTRAAQSTTQPQTWEIQPTAARVLVPSPEVGQVREAAQVALSELPGATITPQELAAKTNEVLARRRPTGGAAPSVSAPVAVAAALLTGEVDFSTPSSGASPALNRVVTAAPAVPSARKALTDRADGSETPVHRSIDTAGAQLTADQPIEAARELLPVALALGEVKRQGNNVQPLADLFESRGATQASTRTLTSLVEQQEVDLALSDIGELLQQIGPEERTRGLVASTLPDMVKSARLTKAPVTFQDVRKEVQRRSGIITSVSASTPAGQFAWADGGRLDSIINDVAQGMNITFGANGQATTEAVGGILLDPVNLEMTIRAQGILTTAINVDAIRLNPDELLGVEPQIINIINLPAQTLPMILGAADDGTGAPVQLGQR